MWNKTPTRKCHHCDKTNPKDHWNYNICPECGTTNDELHTDDILTAIKTAAIIGITLGTLLTITITLTLITIGYLLAHKIG